MKSPLKAKPLRNPGESIDRQLLDLVFDEILPYFSIAFILSAFALLEWLRWLSDSRPNPKLFTFFAVIAVAFAVWKIRAAFTQSKRFKLGRDGEKAVGQFLDRLRESGAQVFHDIPGVGFNVDHVVIHQTGIYVIETKTRSKPDRGETRLVYNGDSVTRNGFEPERNPITQVRAARQWLSELIQESTGKKFPARAVVVYPGWYIEPTAEAKASDVWVLNPKALPSFISQSSVNLSVEDVKLCAYHLSRYVRAAAQ